MPETRSQVSLLIIFTNLNPFAALCQSKSDDEVAAILDWYYESLGVAIERAGGRVVKFIGDGSLIVFPEDRVDSGVEALLELKKSIDSFMRGHGWESRLAVKVHFGTALAGTFGTANDRRYDVVGKHVNAAAKLDFGGVTLSVAAFRKLSPEMRKHFKKSTPPITYIRAEDQHRFRRWA